MRPWVQIPQNPHKSLAWAGVCACNCSAGGEMWGRWLGADRQAGSWSSVASWGDELHVQWESVSKITRSSWRRHQHQPLASTYKHAHLHIYTTSHTLHIHKHMHTHTTYAQKVQNHPHSLLPKMLTSIPFNLWVSLEQRMPQWFLLICELRVFTIFILLSDIL